ncbi:hypothetical protein N1028_13240 [Herbiconiux sp. CPCC 203407]|uniref:Uncharacterized protein n=1 Tax=Herbiconiux oxytropis TaxID=2970915 RepID=A0AA41XIY6_9MICO|nr:hypothetical protein [Herbiconiux oxytropis]MCS5723073.1 hypothetical protein [Herbiconiux oxytropis]MCS5726858.1 hypothetical protein [Herbiconiux oxytropis]
MTAVVRVHGERFVVEEPAALESLREAIRDAVRDGGDIVRIEHRDGVTEVLVATGTPVRIDEGRTASPRMPIPEAGSFVDYDGFDL